jgi:hypothetical protein
MKYLELNLYSQDKIVIELIDNPWVDLFLNQLSEIIKLSHFVTRRDTYPTGDLSVSGIDQASYREQLSNELNEKTEKLKETINAINMLGMDFPVPSREVEFENNTFEVSRKLLNVIHRHFTTGHRSLTYDDELVFTWKFGSNITFEKPENHTEKFKLLSKFLHDINDLVHVIEPHLDNPRLSKLVNTDSIYNEYTVEFKKTHYAQNFSKTIKREDFKFFSNNVKKYDVWLPLCQIQGKDYGRAFGDYDDPKEWDITNNIYYSGSFSIGKRDFYVSNSDFLTFLEENGITPGPLQCGMPIGRVIQGEGFVSSLGARTGYVDKTDVLKDIVITD